MPRSCPGGAWAQVELTDALLSQSIHAQTDYTPKHTCNSTITTQGMPTVILQVLFQKEETRKKLIIFVKEGKLTRLQSPFVH